MWLEGFSACNRNRLTPEEQQAVKQSVADENVESCFNGWLPCDVAALDRRQKREIGRTMRERNLQNCLDEYSECNPGLLTDAERRETVRAVHIGMITLQRFLPRRMISPKARETPQRTPPPFDREIYSHGRRDFEMRSFLDRPQKPTAGIPFVEPELAAIVFPSGGPVSQGSRWSPLRLASRYLETVRSSLDSRDYDLLASRTSFAADRTSETTSPMSESVVR